jgi:hypothetical protein
VRHDPAFRAGVKAQHEAVSSTSLQANVDPIEKGATMLHLDPNTLLAVEVTALAILVALGLWRIVRERPEDTKLQAGERPYDMRRDGQQLGA